MHYRLAVLVCWIAIFDFSNVVGQDVKLPQFIPPSPDAASIGKFGDMPVSTYTGIPDISIPLYTIKVRDISVPITLSYHASGIRVEEDASIVGLGWGLNALSMVSRTVRGNDDLVRTVSGNPPGYVYTQPFPSTTPIINAEGDSINVYPSDFVYDACDGTTDGQPDIFYFNLNFIGYSGKFYLKKKTNEGDPIECILASDKEKISITYDETLQKWTILTKEGIKAVFGTKEYTTSLSGTIPDPLNLPSPLGWEPKPDVISSWYLDKLISPNGEEITFIYDIPVGQSKPVYASRSTMSISQSGNKVVNTSMVGLGPTKPWTKFMDKVVRLKSANPLTARGNPCTPGGYPSVGDFGSASSDYSGSVNITWNVYLKSIQFKNGELKFINGERDDIEAHHTSTEIFVGPRRLNEIEVYQSGIKIKTIGFGYTYYNNNESVSRYLHKRLKLQEITESNGAIAKKPYKFTYIGDNTTAPTFLPAKNSAARDHWGLYNGKEANNTLHFGRPAFVPQYFFVAGDGRVYQVSGADRDTDEESSKQGILGKITHPTQGTTTIFYESNKITAQQVVDNQLEKPGFVLTNDLDGHKKVFELLEKTGVTVNASIICPSLSCWGGQSTPCSFPSEMDLPDSKYAIITNLQTGVQVFTAPYSDYRCKFLNNDCVDDVQKSSCGITRQKDITLDAGRYMLETFEKFGFKAEANVSYTYKLKSNPQSNIIEYKGGGLRVRKIIDHDGLSTANDIIRTYDYTTKLSNGASVSTGKLMTIPKYHTLEFNTFSTGSTVAECTVIKSASYSNVPLGSSAQGSPIGYDKVTVRHGAQGENGYSVFTYKNDPDEETEPYLPNSPATNHSMSNGLLLTETHFTRDGFKVMETINNYLSVSKPGLPAIYTYSTDGCGTGNNGATGYKEYSDNSEWWFLQSKTVKNFDRNDNENLRSHDVVTSYSYGSGHKMIISDTTVTSEGSTMITNYSYALDLEEPANAPMWDENNTNYKHIHAPVLKQEKIAITPALRFLGGVKNNYIYDATKDLVILSSIDKATNEGQYETRIVFDEVDGNGNVLQARQADGTPISYLWGYDNTLPVAQATNANHNQIYYEGFETNSGITADAAASHSGNKHKTTSFNIPFSPPAGEYELSYWKHENSKWSNIIQPYTGPITINGSRLDDIRVYPKNAQMTTYNYDPLVGVITATDANNIPTHYTYDDLQRLVQIKDGDKQTVKGFKYNYKN